MFLSWDSSHNILERSCGQQPIHWSSQLSSWEPCQRKAHPCIPTLAFTGKPALYLTSSLQEGELSTVILTREHTGIDTFLLGFPPGTGVHSSNRAQFSIPPPLSLSILLPPQIIRCRQHSRQHALCLGLLLRSSATTAKACNAGLAECFDIPLPTRPFSKKQRAFSIPY